MPLPNILEFIGSNISQRKFQQAQEKLLNYLQGEVPTKAEMQIKADTTYVDAAVGAISTDASKQYATLDLANADIANIALNKNIFVSEAANGGYWYKATAGATSLTKSPYDPVDIAAADAKEKAEKAEQNAINVTDQSITKTPISNEDKIAAAVELKKPDGSSVIAPFMTTAGKLCYIDEDGNIQTVEKQLLSILIENAPPTFYAGEKLNKIIVDKDGKILEAWSDSGSYFFATETGLKQVASGLASNSSLPLYSSNKANIAGATETRLSALDDDDVCYIIVTYGQSLAQGWNSGHASDSIVATTNPYPANCFMFTGNTANRSFTPIATIEPLKEVKYGGGYVENACLSLAAHVVSEVERVTGKRIRTLSYIAAQGGKPYADLTRGTDPWKTLVQGLIDAKAICKKNGWKPVVLGLDAMLGESDTDQNAAMTTEWYVNQLKQIDREFNAEVQRIFAEYNPKPAIISVCQCGFTPSSQGLWTSNRIRFAQLAANGQGNIRFAAPIYNLTYGDTIHINSAGQNQRGQQVARNFLLEYFATGQRIIQLQQAYAVTNKQIVLEFSVPVEPLVFDTSGTEVAVSGLGNGLGFIVEDMSGNDLAIESVSVSSNNKVIINLVSDIAAKTVKVGYAVKRNAGNTTQDGNLVGARGCLRDSSSFTNIFTSNATRYWAPAFSTTVHF